jgi:hydroxymethylpyrimidine pyrophosphatase-like HAD family hydrolase
MAQEKTNLETLAEQKARHVLLTARKTAVHIRLETDKQVAQEASSEAIRLFGTSDIEELKKMYKKIENDNSLKVAEFIFSLDETEKKLLDIERQIAV